MRQQVTRNDSDEAERSERSPSGVVSVANAEKLTGAARQVSGEAAPASGSAPQPDRPPPPARGSGGCARRPPEPSAGRQSRAHYPPGSLPVLALKSCYPPGTFACSCCKAKLSIKLTCDLKAEMNLRTPKTLRVAGASPKATYPKVAARPSGNQRRPTARRTLSMVFSASAPAFSAPFARTLQT